MRKKKNELIMILISIIVICINNVSLSKYDYLAECDVKTQIAKAILTIEKDETIKKQINQNNSQIEYNFSINNYNENGINEMNFDYQIEIESSVDNFPISYMLFDCDNNKEIKLSQGKSEMIRLSKNFKESRKFKLYLQWREIDGDLAEKIQMNLKINGVQSKEGNK